MLFCLLLESPAIDNKEQMEIDRNMELVAHNGRDERLALLRNGTEIKLSDWAHEICTGMQGICEQLDGDDPKKPYSFVLKQQLEVIADPERTPSALMLAEMKNKGEGFFHFAQRMSLQHKSFFDEWKFSAEREELFTAEASRSIEQQAAMEEADQVSFERFLEEYFDQT